MADENKNDEDTQPIAPPPVAHHRADGFMPIASERLSQVRYVFIVQIEDGVASARSRSCLEYADAVLMAWPDETAEGILPSDQVDHEAMARAEKEMERHIVAFRLAERADQTDVMGDELVKIAAAAAVIRHAYQPQVRIPTIEEISRVVGEEWNEEMGSIDAEELENGEELRHDVEVATQNGPTGNIPSAEELREKREHEAREDRRRHQRESWEQERFGSGKQNGGDDTAANDGVTDETDGDAAAGGNNDADSNGGNEQ